jgi:uncharacterized protein YndB with AHSA1/START domain
MSEEKDLKRVAQQIVILAPPETVWRALSDPGALQVWLAEHAVLEPFVGGKFALWGEGTFGSEIPLESPGKVIRFDPLSALGLEFSLMGTFAQASITILPAEHGSTVVAEYILPNNTESTPWYLTQDHAILFLYNLRSYAETGRTCLQPGDPHDSGVAKVQITISASPADAFAAITIPEIMDTWVSSKATVELHPGGQYLYGWTETKPDGSVVPLGPAKVVAVEVDRLLTTNWQSSDEPPTQVEWLIEGEGEATTVRLTHSGFGQADLVSGYVQGWGAFLCILQAMLEGKTRVEDVPTAATQ